MRTPLIIVLLTASNPLSFHRAGREFRPLLVEATIDPIETAIHLVEAAVDFSAEVVEAGVGPALPHHVHDCTVNISGARVVRTVSDLCDADVEVAAVDADGG
jgi:hypothetical protein